MSEVYLIDTIRSAVGKMGGALKDVTADHLGSQVLTALLNKTNIEKSLIDEVIIGQSKQSADASNIARVMALRSGLPIETTGYTIHRQCGSGLQAINNGAQQIMCGISDLVIAGGAESMSTAPYYLRNARYGYKAGNAVLVDSNTESQPGSQPIEQYGQLTMGQTAENLANMYNISREEQDEFALRSQELAAQAIEKGYFEEQITPIVLKSRKGETLFKVDEHPRKTTIEDLAKLKPVFVEGGTVTAGNSTGRNDGAAVSLLASEKAIEQYGLKPRAKIIAQAVAGVRPDIMGIGPVPATQKALKMANLSLDDIAVIELNEAFSAQSLAVIKELGLDLNKVNVNGGAIALGHPIGATGAILMTKLVNELERRGERYGLVTLCIGGGQGITTIIENLNC